MAYSAVDWLPYLTVQSDPKIVYIVHQYAPIIYTHQEIEDNIVYPGAMDADYDGNKETINKAWLDSLLSLVDSFKSANGVPVACNEFGLVRWVPGGEKYLDHLMELFEQRNMNHAIWVWDPDYNAFTSIVNAFNFRLGSNPNQVSDLPGNKLEIAIKKYWIKNQHRPSQVHY